jgi:hypothetical protein
LGYNAYIHRSAIRKLPVELFLRSKNIIPFFLSFAKLESRKVEQVLLGVCVGGWTLISVGGGRCKYYVHMSINEKNRPAETVPGMGGKW